MPKAPLDVLLFTALVSERQGDGTWIVTPTSDVTFEVSLDDGATFQPAHRSGIPFVPDFFRLPPSPGPISYLVRATPTTPERWPVASRFEHDPAGGVFSRGGTKPGDPSFEPSAWPMPVTTSLEDSSILAAFGFGNATLLHHVAHLSRVRDISDQALALINQGGPIGEPDGWLSSWNQGTPARSHLGRNPLVDGHRLALEDEAVPFFGQEVAILEIADAPVPLVAVSWSKGVLRGGGPTPFLIYVHPDLGQNADFYGGQPYPGPRYLHAIAYRNLYHEGDPLMTANGFKGLTTQVAAARKAAVIVVPIHRLPGHLGALKDASVMEQVLREIQAFFCHRAEIATPPQLGRVALSAFSNGAGIHLKAFLQANQGHSFLTNLVREVYLMDPRMNDEELANAVIAWSHTGPKDDKRVRVYLGAQHGEFLRVVGASGFGASAGIQSSADGRRSVALMQEGAWMAAAAHAGAPKEVSQAFANWARVHEAVPGTMITHALLNSGFGEAFDLGF
jgi:hypothetical protein